MLDKFDGVDSNILVSIIRYGILHGTVCAASRKYWTALMILRNSYADCISFNESGFTLNDFKVSYEFYDILKEEDPDCYMFLINPYAIMKAMSVDIPSIFNDGIRGIAHVLKGFSRTEGLIEYLSIIDKRLITDAYVQFEMIKQGKEDFSSMVVERFFLDAAEKLEQDNSSIIETVKQDFIGLVSNHIEDIKVFTKENFEPTLKAVMGSGIVSQIYESVNDAIDTNQPYTTVVYKVSESDLVNFALQNLCHTGNYGISVNLIYTAFTIIVPLNRLDIVKC